MSDPRDSNRNPLVIPEVKPTPRRGCPKCRGRNFGGQLIYGTMTFKCRDCGNEWQGGIGQEPQDPRIPFPPQDPRTQPIVDFEMRPREAGDRPVPVITRRPDPTPEFRKGAPIPLPGEEDA